MIDSIFVALSGMTGHERGLNVISNNVSNMNTTGFRGSTVSFADVFIGGGAGGRGDPFAGQQTLGSGLDASRTQIDFRAGDRQVTGRDLDLQLNGDGFFIVQDENGELRYTRNGNFDFDLEDELVLLGQRSKVMTRNAGGQLVPMSIKDLLRNPSKATATVTLDGSLSASDSDNEVVIESLDVFDALGSKHTLKVTFTKGTASGASVRWDMSVTEDGLEIGEATVEFIGPDVAPGASPLRVLLSLRGAAATEISFDFEEVDGLLGTVSSLTATQDGFAVGTIATRKFDTKGLLKLTYTNGQTANGATLALARIEDLAGLEQLGDSQFVYRGNRPVIVREGGDDLQVVGGGLERSNVNLTRAFSDLILMQRGYQASSQVLSTANEMLQSLLDLGGRK